MALPRSLQVSSQPRSFLSGHLPDAYSPLIKMLRTGDCSVRVFLLLGFYSGDILEGAVLCECMYYHATDLKSWQG